MDLTEEKVSFDQMPTVVSELKQEISGLKTLVRTLIDAAGAAPKDAWMNIDELRAYHPDHPARPTIYEWVNGGCAKAQAELDREEHIDIADLLLRQNSETVRREPEKPSNSILRYFAPEHSAEVQTLIDELELVPVNNSNNT